MKTWFLDGSTLREFLPGRNEIDEKDFTGASKLLKLARAALSGDFAALEDLFINQSFFASGSGRYTPCLRFELDEETRRAEIAAIAASPLDCAPARLVLRRNSL